MRPSAAVLLCLLAAAFCPVMAVAQSEPESTRPPNIVVFLVDDMGWQDTSVPLHTETTPLNRRYRTPAMERLANEGVAFTQAYAHAICSPTRVSMMTGQNSARHRVTNWTLRRNGSNDRKHPTLEPAQWNVNGLSPVAGIERTVHCAATLPALLRTAGLQTIHVGKAHFGAVDTPAADPRAIGFDVNVAGHAAGGPGSFYARDHFSATRREVNRSPATVWDVPGLEQYHGTDLYLTEALTREAIATIDRAVASNRPFFLHLSHYAVHAPLMPDPRFAHRYADLPAPERAYASMVEGMDESLGDVLDALDAHGIANDTLVIFLSDNGGLTHAVRGGERFTHNAPLSCGKGSAHEGGIRVPMLARWPGVTPRSSRCDVPVAVEDLLPTLCEVTAAEIPAEARDRLDGSSIMPLLRDPASRPAAFDRPLIFHQPNHWTGRPHPSYDPHSSIRIGNHKLIWYHAPDHEPRFELFDLGADLSETTNLADAEPARVRELATRLEQELIAWNADRMTVRATGKPVAWPTAMLPAK